MIQFARRFFIGGSDTCILMGDDEAALIRLWREKRARLRSKICPATYLCSSAARPRRSIDAGLSETRAGRSVMCSAKFGMD